MKNLGLSILLALNVMGYSIFQSNASINQNHMNLIHSIKDTIITTQKTRGLTNNYMNGNVVAQLLVYGQRRQMQKNFKKIKEDLKKLELPESFYKESAHLMRTSKQLNKHAFKSISKDVFTSYTHHIEDWMSLNERIINFRFKKGNQARYQELVFLNNVLLPLTENIGKMRGMGSGIVARGFCKEEESKKMQGFASEIKRFQMLLQYHLSQQEYSALSKKESKAINKNIQDYAYMTEEKVIGKKDINLVTNEYFNQGTRAIAQVLKIYNVVAANIKND